MMQPGLTDSASAATRLAMNRYGKSTAAARVAMGMMGMAGAVTLAGCVSVNAPDKPIVIELNINIKQEVIYKLSADAGKTIDSNKDIF